METQNWVRLPTLKRLTGFQRTCNSPALTKFRLQRAGFGAERVPRGTGEELRHDPRVTLQIPQEAAQLHKKHAHSPGRSWKTKGFTGRSRADDARGQASYVTHCTNQGFISVRRPTSHDLKTIPAITHDCLRTPRSGANTASAQSLHSPSPMLKGKQTKSLWAATVRSCGDVKGTGFFKKGPSTFLHWLGGRVVRAPNNLWRTVHSREMVSRVCIT